MQHYTKSKSIRKLRLDVTKLDKTLFYKGSKGIYCDLLLYDKPGAYGDDGIVIQSVSKEQNDAGKRGAIVGNWRELSKARKEQDGEDEGNEDDGVPF